MKISVFEENGDENARPIGECEFAVPPVRGDFVEICPIMAPPKLYEVKRVEHRGVHSSVKETKAGRDRKPEIIIYVFNGRLVSELL